MITGTLAVQAKTMTATIPTKAHTTDLGYDLYADGDYTVDAGETVVVSTGIGVGFPPGWGAFVMDRSSVATKLKLVVVGGVIDEAYTGTIHVPLVNNNKFTVTIAHGTKLAQLIPIQTTVFDIVQVSELNVTDRGDKGFGSSNVK